MRGPAPDLPPGVAELVARLDAVLVPHGFAPAQGQVAHGAAGLTWCCAGEDWVARFPHLPPSREEQLLEDGRLSCVDVVVEAHREGGSWLLDEVRLEGRGLADALEGGPVAESVEPVTRLVRDLLDGAAAR